MPPRSAGTATVEIIPDAKGFGGRLQKAVRPALGDVGKTASGVFAGLAGTAAVKGLFDFAKDSVGAAGEAEKAQNQLNDAFARTPSLAGANVQAFRSLNTELAKKTAFDDDATASAEAVLARFKLTGDQLKTLTPLVQDYAAKTGQQLPAAALNIGRAFTGNARALKALGVNFKASGDQAKDFAAITDILRSKVGGFAEKEGKTTTGRLEILKNQFGELQESIGTALVPILLRLAGVLTTIVGWFSNLSPGVQKAIGVVAGLVGVVFLIVKATQAWTAVQGALNVVMALNPIGLVVLAVAALVAGVILAYKHSETFRNIVQGAFRAVGDVVRDVIGFFTALGDAIPRVLLGAGRWIADHWYLLLAPMTGGASIVVKLVIDHFSQIVGFFTGLPGRLARLGAGIFDFLIVAAKSAVNAVIRILHTFRIPGFKVDLPGPGPVFEWKGLDPFGGIKELAAGGTAERGEWILAGERGPELMRVASRTRVFDNATTRRALGALDTVGTAGRAPLISGDVIVYNPTPEPASETVPRELRRLSYLLTGA